jgi:hypothetical protein
MFFARAENGTRFGAAKRGLEADEFTARRPHIPAPQDAA